MQKLTSCVLLVLLCLFALTHSTYAADTVLEVGIPGITGAAPGDPAPGIVNTSAFFTHSFWVLSASPDSPRWFSGALFGRNRAL